MANKQEEMLNRIQTFVNQCLLKNCYDADNGHGL